MRSLIISVPPVAGIAVLFVFFCAVCFAARGLVMRRCEGESREELAEQARGLLTGVSATFAFFVGFAISICWGAVTAGQNAVEQQAAAISQLAWEINNVPDKAESAALTDKLKAYAAVAANQDDDYLARGITVRLPSAAPMESLEDAVHTYVAGRSGGPANLENATSALVAASATVAAVANRSLPRPLFVLLLIVAILVSAVMGVSTVTYGRPSMVFVYVWCLIPALSLTVVLALAFPFALRSGLPLAPLRAVAQQLSGG